VSPRSLGCGSERVPDPGIDEPPVHAERRADQKEGMAFGVQRASAALKAAASPARSDVSRKIAKFGKFSRALTIGSLNSRFCPDDASGKNREFDDIFVNLTIFSST